MIAKTVEVIDLRRSNSISRAVRHALLIALPLVTSAALAADPSESPATLRKVEVQEMEIEDVTRTEDTGSYTVDASSSALKMPLSLREIPQTITVVTEQTMEDFNLNNARDVLSFVPGVHVQSERNTEAWYAEARGYPMQFQYDGIPNPVGVGGRGYGTTDSAFLDRVDVIHGAAGLLTGAGSPGGTVNLVRKTPGLEFAASLEGQADSFGGYRFIGDVGGPLTDGGIGGRLVALYEEKDLYMREASGDNAAVYGVLEVPFGDSTTMWVGGEYYKTDDANFGAHFGFPTQPDGTLYPGWSRKLNLGADWSWMDQERYNVFLRGEHLFTNGWRISGMAQLDRTDYAALQANPGSEGIPAVYLGTQLEQWGNRTYQLDIYAEGPFKLFDREHRLVVGFNGAKRKLLNGDYSYTEEPLTFIDDPANWDPSMAPDPDSIDWFVSPGGTSRQDQSGLYTAGRFEVAEPLHVLLGARVSWVKSAWDGTEENSRLTPYGGVVWDFTRTMSAYASYSEIFQPHNSGTIDSNGETLEPVFGENIEVGLKIELLEGAFNGAVALFRLDQTNLAESDPTGEYLPTDPSALRCGTTPPLNFCSRASGKVRNEGVELSAAGALGGGWQITGGYAYFTQDRDQTSDDGGIAYDPITPEHQFNLALSWTSSDGRWNAGASLKTQSETYVEGEAEWDFDGDGDWTDIIPYRVQQDAYTTVGLYGRWEITPKWSTSVAVDNLFDEAYLSGISGPWHGQVWGDGRKFTVKVKTTF